MNIFINYRRDDTKWPAKQLHAELSKYVASNSIFIDVDSLPIGLDFREEISSWISQCDVFLALVGPNWMLEKDGAPRLQNEQDLVRIEIESALTLGIPVVPVLVDGARVPDVEKLPETLSNLFKRNGVILDIRTFQSDVENLYNKLKLVSSQQSPQMETPHDHVVSNPSSTIDQSGNGDNENLTLVEAFLNKWSTWGFTPARIIKWGSQQNGFGDLATLSRSELQQILESLEAQGRARTRTSKTGNLLYQSPR